MDSEWITSSALEYCDSVRDGTHDSPKAVDMGYKLITSKHIGGDKLDLSSANTISEADYQAINKRSKVDVNDILISMIGTVGSVHRVTEAPNYAIKNMGLFKIGDEVKSKYLYFYLKSPMARNYIAQVLAGSTQKFISLKCLRSLPITYPYRREQMEQIVAVLDAIEAKRALVNRVNDYLTMICEVISTESCIEQTETLDSICFQVSDKVSSEEIDHETYVSTESLLKNKGGRQTAASIPKTGKVTRYCKGDTLISNIRPYFKKIWYASESGTCSGDVLVFRAKDASRSAFLFACLLQDRFFDFVMKGAKGTKMPRGDKSQIMSFKIGKSCSCEALSFLNSAVKQLAANEAEIAFLKQLCDALLPKLMSGVIDVSSVNKVGRGFEWMNK